MPEETKFIKMGPSSPVIGLPSPVQWNDDPPNSSIPTEKTDNPDAPAPTATDIYEKDDSSYHSSLTSSTFSSGSLSISSLESEASSTSRKIQKASFMDNPETSPLPSPPPSPKKRCQCVHEMKNIISGKSNKEADNETQCTDTSDLDSNAFYWEASPFIMRQDYSGVLDKALERRCPKLLELLQNLHVEDESVKIAVKELITTNEKVSHVLKRMHEGLRKLPDNPDPNCEKTASTPTSQSKPAFQFQAAAKPLPYSKDVQEVKTLAGQKGYLWKNNELFAYDIAPAIEHLRADIEFAKFDALKQLMDPYVEKYDEAYQKLRQLFRDIVTSGEYRLPLPPPPPQPVQKPQTPPPMAEIGEITQTGENGDINQTGENGDANGESQIGENAPASEITQSSEIAETPQAPPQPQTPSQWIAQQLEPTMTRFNVPSFIKDSKLGPHENEPQYFVPVGKADEFLKKFKAFVAPRERDIAYVSRHFTFDLKKTDDLLHRFLENSEKDDLMLIVHKLGVLLSKPCVLVRLWINFAYPAIAVWLHLMEEYEHQYERRLLSPFFPPQSRKALEQQLTSIGLLDQHLQRCLAVYDAVPAAAKTNFAKTSPRPATALPSFSFQEIDDIRPTPIATSQNERWSPRPNFQKNDTRPVYETESQPQYVADNDDDLKFSSIFMNLFCRN